MGFQLRRQESTGAGAQRIAHELLLASIDGLRFRAPGTHVAIHEFRKRCKSMRGLLRLFRSQLGASFEAENAFYRDLSRKLSAARDAQALLEALARLRRYSVKLEQQGGPVPSCVTSGQAATSTLPPSSRDDRVLSECSEEGENRFLAIESALVERRDQIHAAESELIPLMRDIADQLSDASDRVSAWEFADDGFASLEFGLCQNYARSRKAMIRALLHPSGESFHEWRKRVKYHWHHAQLVVSLAPTYWMPTERWLSRWASCWGNTTTTRSCGGN